MWRSGKPGRKNPGNGPATGALLKRAMCGNHPVKGLLIGAATTSEAFRKVFQRLIGKCTWEVCMHHEFSWKTHRTKSIFDAGSLCASLAL
jgi:hypothetical protein